MDDALRNHDESARHGSSDPAARQDTGPVRAGLAAAGVSLRCETSQVEQRWHQAVDELAGCVHPVGDSPGPILTEGGNYPGAWIEGTGTISTEVLDRFVPEVSERTHLQFARHCRPDGLMPYKLVAQGPGYAQIQIVTPFARSVWKHYRLAGASREYLETMYAAMAGMDAWLASHRDTRSTGIVEAFCAFDTGHDGSPRFWFAPDRCLGGDAGAYDPTYLSLPFAAPDLTANVACQRRYLALIADELGMGEAGGSWREAADRSERALWEQCYHSEDQCFYDRLPNGGYVEIVSDVLGRVLACEIGDGEFFENALRRYIMNTRHFLAPGGWTSLSLSDPRFDRDFTRNSWGGPVNFLALLRAPAAFEHHGHVAELAIVERSVLGAMLTSQRFPQCLDPWSGSPGFTDHYSPSILWFLDAVERNHGIMPRDDGSVWFSAAPLPTIEGHALGELTYTRTVNGVRYEQRRQGESVHVSADGQPWVTYPVGWRVVTRQGRVEAVVGMAAEWGPGEVTVSGEAVPCLLGPNHVFDHATRQWRGHAFVAPVFD